MTRKIIICLLVAMILCGICACDTDSKAPSASPVDVPPLTSDLTPSAIPSVSPLETPSDEFIIQNEQRFHFDLPVYPSQEVSDEIIGLYKTVKKLVCIDLLKKLESGDGQILIGDVDMMFLPGLLSHSLDLSVEDYEEYYDTYGVYFEGLIETEIVDEYYYGIFSKDARNITPSYYITTIDDGRLFYYPTTGAETSCPSILKSWNITDNAIELIVYTMVKDIDTLWNVKNRNSPVQVGRVEGVEYILENEAIDTLSMLKYTFILEDGEYKIYAIELANPTVQTRGDTMIFEYSKYFTDDRLPFSVEVTGVAYTETKTGNDDAGNPREYMEYVLYPGSMITIINADMEDGRFSEKNQSLANWSVSYYSGEHIPITDDMLPLEITSNMLGIVNNEASVLILTFKIDDEA